MSKLIKTDEKTRRSASKPETVRREYAGKFIAWDPSGKRIVAVANTFDAAEKKAAKAGYPSVAVTKVPKGRTVG